MLLDPVRVVGRMVQYDVDDAEKAEICADTVHGLPYEVELLLLA